MEIGEPAGVNSSVSQVVLKVGATGLGTIFVDGQELKHVRSVNVQVRAGELTRIFIEVLGDVELEAAAEVQALTQAFVREEVTDALVRVLPDVMDQAYTRYERRREQKR